MTELTLTSYPNLAGVAKEDLVEKIKAGSFSAAYINWSRTMNLLRVNAPGWLPELAKTDDGSVVWPAPTGGFLMIYFRNGDETTPAVPQAIMDNNNNSVPWSKISARDITDTHRRGVCMAAAFTFGLAYELWAKLPLETGYADEVKPEPEARPLTVKVSPSDGVWDALDTDTQIFLEKTAIVVREFHEAGDAAAAYDYIQKQQFNTDEKAGLNTLLDSKVRSALGREHEALKKAAAAAKAIAA